MTIDECAPDPQRRASDSRYRHTAWLCAWAALYSLGMASGAGAAGAGSGPAFDCAKAQGEVEQLLCKDDALAALDRRLDAAFRAALAKARGTMAGTLRTEQRGWVKGRNECWKAKGQPTWITASWTVDSVRACVDAQTRLRTAELQALWRLAPPQTQAYACQGQPANEVLGNAFATDPPTLRLERGDRTATLWRVPAPASADGVLFEGANVSATQRGPRLQVQWLDTRTGQTEQLDCTPR